MLIRPFQMTDLEICCDIILKSFDASLCDDFRYEMVHYMARVISCLVMHQTLWSMNNADKYTSVMGQRI